MKLTLTLNNEAKEDLLDIGQPFSFIKDDDDGHIVTTVELDDEEGDVLLESMTPDELVEFFGIDSEHLIYVEIN